VTIVWSSERRKVRKEERRDEKKVDERAVAKGEGFEVWELVLGVLD
jgi:hypothetical protein